MGTLRITSNDEASPAEVPVLATPLPFFDGVDVVSKDGVVQLFGITEFADVSDPPRKYLSSWPNQVGWQRQAAPGGMTPFNHRMRDRLVFDTTGAKTGQMNLSARRGAAGGTISAIQMNGPAVPADTPWSLGNSYSGSSVSSESAQDTYENVSTVIGTTDWASWWITWQREKRKKYYRLADITEHPNEFASSPAFMFSSGLIGTLGDPQARTNLFVAAVWKGTFWRLIGFWDMLGPGIGSGPTFTLRIKMLPGDQMIDDVSDGAIVTSGLASLGATVTQWWSVDIPPDTSVRLRLDISGGNPSTDFPTIVGVESAQLEAGVKQWIYLPPVDTETPSEYSENLGSEDTYDDAFARTAFTLGTDPVAVTRSVAGGTAAESYTPLDVDLRVVDLTFNLKNLTAGNTYRATVVRRLNTIGLEDYTTTTETQDFDAITDTHVLPWPQLRAPTGMELKLTRLQLDLVGPTPAPTPTPDALETETLIWYGNALANGGTFEADTLSILNAFVVQAKAQTWWSKVSYMLPLMGGNLAAALTPLVGLSRGRPTNVNFVDADFSQSTGLQGNGTSKILNLPFTPAQIGSSSNGGIGTWALNPVDGTTTLPTGMLNNPGGGNRGFYIALRVATGNRAFGWGLLTNEATAAGAPAVAHYYGQRSSATSRRLFQDAVEIATNVTNDTAGGITAANLRAMGDDPTNVTAGPRFWGGRDGLFYYTNGTLTDPEITSLHETVRDYLMTPTGRI